jgi:MarR family transcriptional regulator for hemolysin
MLADVPEPFPLPIGLRLAQASRTVERAFDAALADAEGSLPVWLILLNLKIVQVVTLTEAGEAVFLRLRAAAIAFDARLRAGFAEADLASLDAQLRRLAANAGAKDSALPWPASTLSSTA